MRAVPGTTELESYPVEYADRSKQKDRTPMGNGPVLFIGSWSCFS